MAVAEKHRDEHVSRTQSITVGIGVWIALSLLAILYVLVGRYTNLPTLPIDPVFHGAVFLGASFVVAVIVAFASFGLVRAVESRNRLDLLELETDRLVQKLDARFDKARERASGRTVRSTRKGKPMARRRATGKKTSRD